MHDTIRVHLPVEILLAVQIDTPAIDWTFVGKIYGATFGNGREEIFDYVLPLLDVDGSNGCQSICQPCTLRKDVRNCLEHLLNWLLSSDSSEGLRICLRFCCSAKFSCTPAAFLVQADSKPFDAFAVPLSLLLAMLDSVSIPEYA